MRQVGQILKKLLLCCYYEICNLLIPYTEMTDVCYLRLLYQISYHERMYKKKLLEILYWSPKPK